MQSLFIQLSDEVSYKSKFKKITLKIGFVVQGHFIASVL